MKLSALKVGFSSSILDSLASTKPALTGVKNGYFLKSGYFMAIGSFNVTIVAYIHRHVAYHNKQ